jgi:hypothetical protein
VHCAVYSVLAVHSMIQLGGFIEWFPFVLRALLENPTTFRQQRASTPQQRPCIGSNRAQLQTKRGDPARLNV